MSASTPNFDQHPDVATMRRRYDEIAETPVAQSADGLVFLAGIYMAVSPWVVGFNAEHATMTANNLITGLAVAALAIGFAAVYGHMHGIAWVAPVLGLWLIVSPWLVDGDTPRGEVLASNIITGGIIVLCALAMMSTGMRKARS